MSLGLPGIIDVHTHFMPKRVLDKVWAYFDRVGPLIGRPWPVAYRTDETERVETLRRFLDIADSLIRPVGKHHIGRAGVEGTDAG